MAKQVIERWMPSNLMELREALDEMVHMLRMDGEGDDETVYVCVRDLALVKETLTDGSTVFNVLVRENR
jgi:hypothetical protein